ncbi:MAG: hypothetical protein NUV84_04555 [Candidatus Uhrbacteria bacterium]|nr:hypothetical protein [Candidatus Uhrbacteria bacterium]
MRSLGRSTLPIDVVDLLCAFTNASNYVLLRRGLLRDRWIQLLPGKHVRLLASVPADTRKDTLPGEDIPNFPYQTIQRLAERINAHEELRLEFVDHVEDDGKDRDVKGVRRTFHDGELLIRPPDRPEPTRRPAADPSRWFKALADHLFLEEILEDPLPGPISTKVFAAHFPKLVEPASERREACRRLLVSSRRFPCESWRRWFVAEPGLKLVREAGTLPTLTLQSARGYLDTSVEDA